MHHSSVPPKGDKFMRPRPGISRLYAWLALLLAAALLAGCAAAPPAGAPAGDTQSEGAASGEAAAEAPADSGEVSREETLIFAADLTDQLTLDPAVAYEFGGIQVVGNVYETLVSFEPGQPGVKPLLAESWD